MQRTMFRPRSHSPTIWMLLIPMPTRVTWLLCYPSHSLFPPEQIATIGDMPNDVLMFEKSGLSIAMGNASTEVQRKARFVTSSNEEEGFANAIEKFILGRASTGKTMGGQRPQ